MDHALAVEIDEFNDLCDDYPFHAPSAFVALMAQKREERKRRDREELVSLFREEQRRRRQESVPLKWGDHSKARRFGRARRAERRFKQEHGLL